MKRNICAIGALFITMTAAHAQESATTVYGLVDTGVEYLNNVGPTRSNVTRMPSLTGTLPSRIGFRGTEDLGGGLKGVFTVESGFALDSGILTQGGRLFGRQAFVGLSGSWGTLSLGRQYTMLYWSLFDSDILGPNIYGASSLDSYLPNARADNSISYRGTFQGLTLGASYSFGRDTVNAGPSPSGANCPGERADNKVLCREWSAMAKLDREHWGVSIAHDHLDGGPGAYGGLNSNLVDRRTAVAGYVKHGHTKVGVGILLRENEANATPRSNLSYLQFSHALRSPLLMEGAVVRLNTRDSSDDATLVAIRVMYSLSKRTIAYTTAGHVTNGNQGAYSVSTGAAGSNPLPGVSQTGITIGLRHVF